MTTNVLFFIPTHYIRQFPLYSNRVNLNITGPSYDNFHRNQMWLLWADSRFILVFRKLSLRYILVVAAVVGFAIFRLDPPVCEEIAKTARRGDFDLAETVAYRVVLFAFIRFSSLRGRT